MSKRPLNIGQLLTTRKYGNYKLIAIGRNYAEHAKEMASAVPKEPFFFLKPPSSYMPPGHPVQIPPGIEAHHEVELGVVISQRACDIPSRGAEHYIGAYTLAVDMTARNLQAQMKRKGLPWTVPKGFDTFTPMGPLIEKVLVQDPHSLRLKLSVNDVAKQDGLTSDMIFKIPELISYVSSIMTLYPGDIILTGTPAGVGPVVPGDKVHCQLLNSDDILLSEFSFGAAERAGLYKFTPEEQIPST